MGGLWENVAVGVIVGVALLWAVRALVRNGRQKKVCSSCSSAGDCPLVGEAGAEQAAGCGETVLQESFGREIDN